MADNETNIRVYVCEDDPVFTGLLLDRLKREADLDVVGTAVSKITLLAAMEKVAFDVLLLDLNLADKQMEGLDISLELRDRYPELKVIVLSSLEQSDIVTHTLGFGRIANYITKQYVDDIPDAIRAAHHNRSGIHHSAAHQVLNALSVQQDLELRSKITPKQVQILQLQDAGYSRKEISEMLYYSEYTINNELCKVSMILKGKFPYLEWLRLKKHNSKEILQLAKQLHII